MSDNSALHAILHSWSSDPDIRPNIVFSTTIAETQPAFLDFPGNLSPLLINALKQNGIEKLYSHQRISWDHAGCSENLVIQSGTASGKSLCYLLPILDSMINNSSNRALMLFPTKALAQDQLKKINDLISQIPGHNLMVDSYDGDTPSNKRSIIREKANIIVTNPDMLHLGILPHHTKWMNFLKNLKFIVIDEIHSYRGVFGSHVANVLRRLERITNHYQSQPQFFMTSATIGNSRELASRLTGKDITVLAEDGAGHGNRKFMIYNPPLSDPDLGIRKSAIMETVHIASPLLNNNLQSIIFSRTRRSVEVILTSFHKNFPQLLSRIKGYRSGYLPSVRREIEKGLREKDVLAVIATNALELGIDIGALDVSILVGYPGSISSTIQQIGRAGRKFQDSLAVLVATPDPVDQFLARNPDYLLGLHPENALIDPNHLLLLLSHLQCAAFELPFLKNDHYGDLSQKQLSDLLDFLTTQGTLHNSNGKYYWMKSTYPSSEINLRSTSPDRVDLKRLSGNGYELFGVVDRISSYWMVHPGAIYLHEGQTYLVDDLNLSEGVAIMHEANEDYYTEPLEKLDVQIITTQELKHIPNYSMGFGDLQIINQVLGYKKLKNITQEILATAKLDLPEFSYDTTGMWFSLSDDVVEDLRESGNWLNDPNNYGEDWNEIRYAIRKRDGHKCRHCGLREGNIGHHVHHIVPLRMMNNLLKANDPENLITLCPNCHQRAEQNAYVRSGLTGLAYALRHILPIHLMCDIEDIEVHSDPASSIAENKPTIIIFDAIQGGIGLSRMAYEMIAELLPVLHSFIDQCPCKDGCPSCIGPAGEEGYGGKRETLAILDQLTKVKYG